MPDFPTRQDEILDLAYRMSYGYIDHPQVFPHVLGTTLRIAQRITRIHRDRQTLAYGQLRLAGAAKSKALRELIAVMKQCLKRAQADTSGHPEKLALIGWSPKAQPLPIAPPGSPTGLRPVHEGTPGELTLEWKKPADGGAVRNYMIQRRSQNDSGQYSPWQILDTVYDTTATCTNQPQGVRMEYRVKAANAAGQSTPSNSIAITL